jgi:DeoR/GlpR family transcriptional regulator of sugar metabolism
VKKVLTQDLDCLPEERQRIILERLASEGRVVALDLAQQFGTSEDTIRRDLRELAAAGLCHRVYGGALPISPASTSITHRASLGTAQKKALGEKLASLLPQGVVVFVDAGSTNLAAMRALPESHAFTLITNSPQIAAEVVGRENVELIVIGGRVDPSTGGTFGVRTLRDIADLRPDVYLLGTCALDVVAGIAVFGFDEAEFKRTLLAQSRRVIAAATNDKLGTSAPFAVASLHVLGDLVLEPDAPAEWVLAAQQQGISIHHSAALPGSAA